MNRKITVHKALGANSAIIEITLETSMSTVVPSQEEAVQIFDALYQTLPSETWDRLAQLVADWRG